MSISEITRLHERGHALKVEMRELLDKADAEDRSLTSEEEQTFDRMEQDVQAITKDIQRRERVAGIKFDAGINSEATTDETAGAVESRGQGVASEEYREAFFSGLRKGFVGLTPEEKRDLSVGTNSAGGYTVPTDLESSIYEYGRFQGAVSSLATTLNTTGGNPLNIPVVSAFGTSGWTSEGSAFTESDPTFAQIALSAYKGTHIAQVSEELLADSAVDMEGMLTRIFGENLVALEESAFVIGDGSGKPTGLTAASGGTSAGKTAASASAVTADELVDLFHSVSPVYRSRPNCAWLAADGTIASIRKLKTGVSGDNTYLWQPGLAAGQPDTLLGKPIYAHPNMPTIAASAKVIEFGDMSAYYIRRAGGLEVQRLNELYAASGQVGFRAYVRVDAKLVDNTAVKHLAMAAS